MFGTKASKEAATLVAMQDTFERPNHIGNGDWTGIPDAMLDIARKTWERARHRSHEADDEMLETLLIQAIVQVRNE